MFFLSKAASRRVSRLSYPALCACFLFNSALFGQNKVPDSILLKTVVIQSTRVNARTPVPHNNYDAQQIAQSYQAQDIPYLLSNVPSLVESSDAGTGTGYTGLRIRGSDPTRINVTLNGIPLNDAESQIMYWVDLPDLAASAAEIQVQRGVGASTNGAGAFGATVNVDLSRVEAEPFADVSNTLGSFGTRKHSACVGTGLLNGRFAFSGRLSAIHSDGYIDRASVDLNAYHLTGTYLDDGQSIQLHLLSGHERTYQAWNGVPAQYVNEERLRTFNTAGIEQPGTPYPDEVDDYTQRHFLIFYKRHFKKGWSVQYNAHYTQGFGFYEQYRAGEILADYKMPSLIVSDTTLETSDLVRRRWLDNDFFGSTFALQWKPSVNPPRLSGPPLFTLGGAASRYLGRHFGEVIWAQIATSPNKHRYYDNDAGKTDANLFFKTEAAFSKGLGVFLDLQYRMVQYQFLGFDSEQNNVTQSARLHFFNPKAGLSWKIGPWMEVYGFFGVAHREPNRDDYTQSTPQSRPRPERLFDWEGGLRGKSRRWNLGLNLYWMQYKDQLVLDGRLNDVGAYIRTNVKDSYRGGIELEAGFEPDEHWRLGANLALSRNKIGRFTEYRDNWDTGLQDVLEYRNTDLAYSPNAIGRAEISYALLSDFQAHSLRFTLTGKYVARQFLDNTSNPNTVLPQYFFSDFRINYGIKSLLGGNLNLILAVNNLLDARYSSNGWTYRYTSGFDNRPYDPYTRQESDQTYNQTGFFPQAGRNWMATLVLHF